MRASTVFILALALLAGLAAAAGARYVGLFTRKDAPPPPEKPPALKVLVLKINLYEDIALAAEQVAVEELPFEEHEAYSRMLGANWRDKLMPPDPRAAHLRVAKQTVRAGQVLLKEYFMDPALPDSLSARLEPNTRAVNVTVPKDKAAGGSIRLGEFVDVLLTSRIGSGNQEELRTACIARACKVVMKRNNPWTVMMSDPDDKPVHFTLQANAYRAALIEFAQTHGQLSLLPVQAPARAGGTYSDPASKEYATEDQRIDGITRGDLAIGDRDLARIFHLTAPETAAPPPPPVVTRHLIGVREAGQTAFQNATPAAAPPTQSESPSEGSSGLFGVPATPPAPMPGPNPPPSSGTAAAPRPSAQGDLTFRMPSATGTKDCPTCDENKKRAAAAAAKSQ
ncbi:Flp pilus assembly protein CpaB [Fimbriiglobus ruber]|uniref:Flp pilus assembly protein RcpC/CpaB domain-containing protein n=1 Tax=Fimbriiglobus ruber TaxID=1908690 RepID=A0A225DGN1_9BACT|nr:Flp pilus assembly protein CpaB [Fimbriiglobus ruber]OWK35247.1 hypothetical protein FRUB_09408 [Fimbriiglobus ruber]